MADKDHEFRTITAHGEVFISKSDLQSWLTAFAEKADAADRPTQAATARVIRDAMRDFEVVSRRW